MQWRANRPSRRGLPRACRALSDLDDLELARATGARDFDAFALAVPKQCFPNWRLQRNATTGDIDFGGPDNGEGLFTKRILDHYRRSQPDLGGRRLRLFFVDDRCVANHVLEREDAALDHPLFVLGLFVFGVL